MKSESSTYSSKREGTPDLRLLHYNDVYHVEPGSAEPVGGIARFQTLCNYYRDDKKFEGQPGLLTLFSGDAFNPSLESSVTKGSHMVPLLNNIGTDVACVGNHDLDFGMDQFRHLTRKCKFPWLLANVLNPALGDDIPLGNANKTTMLTSSNGIKIGVIGIVEKEWLDTINSLPPNLTFLDPVKVVTEHAESLRKEGAEMVIALTHQREPNDIKLVKSLPEGTIDILVGGHDHFYAHDVINGVHLLRSGTDFKQLSYVEVWRKEKSGKSSQSWDFTITRRDVTRDIPQDEKTVGLVNKMTADLRARFEKPIGYTISPLDARFTTVRLKESNFGNFVCDLMRTYYSADCCIMAAGTIRGDQVYPPGLLRKKDIMSCFPFEDPCVVLKVSGKAIFEALENGVSTYPALEGRFPQVSNIRFSFDPNKEPGHRIVEASIAGEPLDRDSATMYKLVTRAYMAHGKDGYQTLRMESEGGDCEELVSDENGMLISALLRQYFMSLRITGRFKNWGSSMSRHWGSVQDNLHEIHPVRQSTSKESEKNDQREEVSEKDSTVQQGRQSEVENRKGAERTDKPTDSTKGAAAHGGEAHQGSDLVTTSLDTEHTVTSANVPDASSSTSSSRSNSSASNDDASSATDDDSDDSDTDLPATAPLSISDSDRRRVLARRVARHWWKRTGLQGHPGIVDDEEEDKGEEAEDKCTWTRGIVAKVEGRIVCLGSEEEAKEEK